MLRPLRRVLFGMALFVFTATVILAVAEGAARLRVGDLPGYVLRFGVHQSPEVAFDPYLGWKAVPVLDAEQQLRWGGRVSEGRDPEQACRKA